MKQTPAASGLRCIRLGATRYLLAVPADAAPVTYDALLAAGAQRAGTAAWQLTMIRAGLPLITAPTQEEFVAQMLNYELDRRGGQFPQGLLSCRSWPAPSTSAN